MRNDFSALKKMIYSGRGITVGLTPAGHPFIAYSLTGRSPSSQARELLSGENTKITRTSVTDEKELTKGSPALLLYPAVVPVLSERYSALICSNGAQTKLIYSTMLSYDKNVVAKVDKYSQIDFSDYIEPVLQSSFQEPFYEYDERDDRWIDITTFEPDHPNYTPRISALILHDRSWKKNHAGIHIVWRDTSGQKKERIYKFDLIYGQGNLITTYAGHNDKPLSPFIGELLEVGIESDDETNICQSIYNTIKGDINGINPQVSAAVVMLKNGKIVHKERNRFKPKTKSKE